MKNKWMLFTKCIEDLRQDNLTNTDIKKKWFIIKNDFKDFRPNHLIAFLDTLNKNKITINSKILDHGCGSGATLFFLALNGYKNIWGIDINDTKHFNVMKKFNNKIFRIILNSKDDRIQSYNGKRIPFKNSYFDFIFSQQVIEHVESKLFNHYLAEEKRTLNKNGIVLHQIPHRLGPFEGHTKRWIIHWFPKKLYHYIIKNDAYKLSLVKNYLFLKWPWKLIRHFNIYFNQVDNISYIRLKHNIDSNEYSKKEKIIRKILVFFFNLPLVGKLFISFFAVFFQLEILAKNK
jgi:SAM-dependent methyltransferase